MERTYYRVIDNETGIRKQILVHRSGTNIKDFMEEIGKAFKIDDRFDLFYQNEKLIPISVLGALDLDTTKYPIHIVRRYSNRNLFSDEQNVSGTESQRRKNTAFLPSLHNISRESNNSSSLSAVDSITLERAHSRYNVLRRISRRRSPEYSPDFDEAKTQEAEESHSLHEEPASRSNKHSTLEVFDATYDQDTQENTSNQDVTEDDRFMYDFDSRSESEIDDDSQDQTQQSHPLQRNRRMSKSEPMMYEKYEHDSHYHKDEYKEFSSHLDRQSVLDRSASPTAEVESYSLTQNNDIVNFTPNAKPRSITIQIQSLCKTFSVNINESTTMKNLIHKILDEESFGDEQHMTDSSTLLIFNHRLHIFVSSNPDELVIDFLKLSPANPVTNFYVYPLPREYHSFMYDIEVDHDLLFKDSDAWNALHFRDYKQEKRSQSILLSSLYALRLYFRPTDEKFAGFRRAMEAQFFIQLRNYLYPPAILALKHAIDGYMFIFEKTLLMDALIQLLRCLCPETTFKYPNIPCELLDFAPILFCWLLEMCDPYDEEPDHFVTVTLIDMNNDERPYFQNPVTLSEINRQKLQLEEFDEKQVHSHCQRHVDLRSLTRHLTSITSKNSDTSDKLTSYEIYDPICDATVNFENLPCWVENDITKLHAVMSEKYTEFTIATRGDLTTDIANRLTLLRENHTVSFILSRQNNNDQPQSQQASMNHFFFMFNPLVRSVEPIVVKSEDIADEKTLPDPRLPQHLNKLFVTKPKITSKLQINEIKPAGQVTIILLDMSRSMFDNTIDNHETGTRYTHIDMCKMMLGTLNDNMLPKDETHAFGLIEFGEKVDVTCPITRSQNKFEKALKNHTRIGEWTYIYDAVSEAIRRIKAYTSSPLRAEKNCRRLIICLSDGMNNKGTTTIGSLAKGLEDNNIVIDFISFLRDEQIDDKNKIEKIREFRQLCLDSGGYVYSNLHERSNIDIAGIFEQEAAVWLSKRSRIAGCIVDKPERRIHPIFQQLAVRQLSLDVTDTESSRRKRILNEFKMALRCPRGKYFVFIIRDNIAFWKLILAGPDGTSYEHKYWLLYIEFSSNYPSYPPNVRFVTPIFHANITGDGKICHEIFTRNWAEATKMTTVFEHIIDLLRNPNFNDAASIEKAQLFKENPGKYFRQAKAHAHRHAKNSLEEFNNEFEFNDDGPPKHYEE